MKTEFLIVKNNLIAETTWGKKRVINLTNGEAIWINDTTTSTHIKPGEQIEVIRDSKNKLSIIDRGEDKPNIPKSNGYVNNGTNTPNTPNTPNTLNDKESVLTLDIPQPMSEADKKKLALLIKERAKIMSYCIKIADTQLKEDGYSFNEISIKSLGLSLFIHISRHLN